MDAFGAELVEVNWLPYIIDPGTDPDGEDYLTYNRRRWGGDGWTHSLRQRGAAVGAPFHNWRWWPNTVKAHCLVQFAESKGLSSSEVKAVLFQALYEEGVNVSGAQALADLASEKLGLDREEVLQYLESGAGVVEVLRAVEAGREVVQGGVPFFVISLVGGASQQRPYGFSGAQPQETFLEVMRKVAGA